MRGLTKKKIFAKAGRGAISSFIEQSITYSDLSTKVQNQTITDGFYKLSDGNNPGLVLEVFNGQLSPKGNINHSTFSQASIVFDAPTPATSGVFKVQIDGVDISSPPTTWDDTWLVSYFPQDLWQAVAIAAPQYNQFPIGDTWYIDNTSTATPVLSIVKVSGDDPPVNTINNFSGGSTYSLQVDYNLAGDAIKVYYDNNSNKTTSDVINFPFSNVFSNNDFTQDGGTDFGGYNYIGNGITRLNNNNHYGGSYAIFNTLSDGVNSYSYSGIYNNNNLYNGSVVDVRNSTGDFTNNTININGGVFYTQKTCNGLIVNTETSNYQNALTVTSNTIDFNEGAGIGGATIYNWTGIVDANGQLKTVNGLSNTCKHGELRPDDTSTITIDWTDVTNISVSKEVQAIWNVLVPLSTTITLEGTKGDWAEWYNDGTNLYIIDIHTNP